MTNKELLEFAAKAAGIDYNAQDGLRSYPQNKELLMYWNPLTDDGDALRLAVKLKMEVYHGNDEGEAVYASYVKPNSVIAYCVEYYDDLSHKGDPYAATRRAIVRAAAEIGKTK